MSQKKLFHYKQFAIDQSHAAMKVGTDSDLLGTLAQGGNRILDVGTGTGVLSLMLAQRYELAHITAVEIDDLAVIDARTNFAASPMGERIALHHMAFQEFVLDARARNEVGTWDAVVCNPPYFDLSLECPDDGRTRARHSSSLPFDVLAHGAHEMLVSGGTFSVCIPPEVLRKFKGECQMAGFSLEVMHRIKTLPHNPPKRLVLVMKKSLNGAAQILDHTMLNADGTRSAWYCQLMHDFLLNM